MVFSPRIVSRAKDLIWKQYVEPVLGNPALPYVRLSPAVAWQAEALRLAETAWDAGAFDRAEYPLRVRHFLSRLLSLVGSNAEAAEGETRATGQYQRDERRVKKALLFIDGNYAEGIGIEDIARSAEISVSTCLRLFRSVLGTTARLPPPTGGRGAHALRRQDGRRDRLFLRLFGRQLLQPLFPQGLLHDPVRIPQVSVRPGARVSAFPAQDPFLMA